MQNEDSSTQTRVRFADQSNNNSQSSSNQPDEYLQKLQCLENLVLSALQVTKGACIDEATQLVESALRRGKTKSKMLGHCIYDSSVFLSAMNEIQESIPRLPTVLRQNASIMNDIQHNQSIINSVDKSSSQIAQNNDTTLADTTTAFEALGVSSSGSAEDITQQQQQQQNRNNDDEVNSVMSVITTGSNASPSDLESTASATIHIHTTTNNNQSSYYSNIAHSILQPLRSFANTLEHSTMKPSPSSKEFQKQLSMKKDKSSDLILAQQLDFDECESPRSLVSASAQVMKTPPPRVVGSCLEYGIAADGSSLAVKPLDEDVHQFAPMSPMVGGNMSVGMIGGDDVFGEEEEEAESGVNDDNGDYNNSSYNGGTGRILILKGEMAPSQQHKRQ